MPLFNKKTLDRYLGANPAPDKARFTALEEWAAAIKTGRVASLVETELHAQFQQKVVVEALGYRGPIGNVEYTVTAEKNILKGAVDLAFGNFGDGKSEIIAPFELKGAKTKDLDAIMPGRAKSPVDQAWEYANNNSGTKWVLVSNYLEIRLYAYAEGRQFYERFDLSSSDEAEYAKLIFLLSPDSLLGTRTFEVLEDSRRENRDITNRLYGDYKLLRSSLIEAVRKSDASVDPLAAIRLGQTILDRVLFIAFAEDTGLLPRETLFKAYQHNDPYNPKPVWQNFLGLFRSIDTGNKALDIPKYNGGLFKDDPEITRLNISDEICEGFKQLADYDFASEVSVTVLGHIFEQSITDVEILQAEARGQQVEAAKSSGTSGRRKRDGVVYTPDYIARFIVEKTIGAHLSEVFDGLLKSYAAKGAKASDDRIKWKSAASEREAWSAYRQAISKLRVVDPACGSGVFLVMAFDFLKAEIVRVNGKIAELTGKGFVGDLLDPDSQILSDNLFGVDVNEESIEIAKLSLWIKTARRGKVLDSLDGNFRVGDSLVEDSNYAYRSHGFVWKDAFADVFAQGRFDIVLGNPPYVRMEYLKNMKPYLQKRFEVVSDRADLYAYFFERGLKLLKPNGRLGFISSATFFKTGAGEPLREYLRTNATLENVVNFGDLQIFDGVTTYPAILSMKNAKPEQDHKFRFLNLDSLPADGLPSAFEEKASDYPQSALTNASWEMEGDTLRELREKIRRGKSTLKEVYGSPYAGIKTGFNEAFILTDNERDALLKADPSSADLIKPIVFGNEVHKWRVERKGLSIIYIPKNKVDIDRYPAIKSWLLRHKPRLEKRAADQKWFELQQAQERFSNVYSGTKLIYRDIADTPTFSVDTASYPDMTCFCLKGASYFEAALLNSKLMWFILTSTTTIASGGFFRMKTQYLEPLPIPKTSEVDRDELGGLAKACQQAAEKRHTVINKVVRRFPDLCPANREPKVSEKLREWWAMPDFKAFQAEIKKVFKVEIPLAQRSEWEEWLKREKDQVLALDREISSYEKRIDAKVYQLFALTPADVSVVEAAL